MPEELDRRFYHGGGDEGPAGGSDEIGQHPLGQSMPLNLPPGAVLFLF